MLNTPHDKGWQLEGCVAAPPAAFPSADQQLLYVNKQLISCPVLQQLLRDWFTRSLKAFQAANQMQGSRSFSNSMKTAEPGYVLLLTCPASAVLLTQQGGTAGQAQADFSPSMQQLLQLLQAAIGPAWGNMPTAWRGAALQEASAGDGSRSGGRTGRSRCSGSAAAPDNAQEAQQQWQEQQQNCSKPAGLLPVHGLQLSSRTRTLAASLADPQVRLVEACQAATPRAPRQAAQTTCCLTRRGCMQQSCLFHSIV